MKSNSVGIVNISHSSCFDGLVASWVVDKYAKDSCLSDLTHHFMKYGEASPDVTGKLVLITDFSSAPEVLVEMCKTAKLVVVLDHHDTAVKKIEKYFETTSLPSNLDLRLDITKSGAGLTWEFLYPNQKYPDIVRYAQDYDLWKFEFPESRAAMAFLGTMPLEFASVDYIVTYMAEALKFGNILVDKENEMVRWHMERMSFQTIDNLEVPVVNAPHYIASWLADELNKTYPFSVIFSDHGGMRRYSFRSRKDGGYNVREIAERLGFGGHDSAAGAEIPIRYGTDIQQLMDDKAADKW